MSGRYGDLEIGARTPEELEALFEDALLLRDADGVADLFAAGAMLVVSDGPPARGEEIARSALATWGEGRPYLADPRQVFLVRDVALILDDAGANVARRGTDGAWRYAIVAKVAGGGRMKEREMAIDTSRIQDLNPLAVASDEGEARWWLGGLAVIKARAADTGGKMSIIDVTNPPGDEAPLHVHHREDEGFWILEGSATFEVGGVTSDARPGDYLFGPRGVPHRFSVGPEGCRMLFLMTPGGFEEMIIAMSEPAGSRTLPPPMTEEPDWEQVAAIAAAYGCELLG